MNAPVIGPFTYNKFGSAVSSFVASLTINMACVSVNRPSRKKKSFRKARFGLVPSWKPVTKNSSSVGLR